jgi:hypothetical protein
MEICFQNFGVHFRFSVVFRNYSSFDYARPLELFTGKNLVGATGGRLPFRGIDVKSKNKYILPAAAAKQIAKISIRT